jgi:CRISPR-associated protein Cmr3
MEQLMHEYDLEVTFRDPVIIRDGRPFGKGNTMHSRPWITPSAIAGSLRTMLGKKLNREFDEKTIELLKSIQIQGPFIQCGENYYTITPKDCVCEPCEDNTLKWYKVRPMKLEPGEGSNLPGFGLLGGSISEFASHNFKSEKIPAFWSWNMMLAWLKTVDIPNEVSDLKSREEMKESGNFLPLPAQDTRIHIKIDLNNGNTEESFLFQTTGLDISHMGFINNKQNSTSLIYKILVPSELGCPENFHEIHPFGGERRLTRWNMKLGTNTPVNYPKNILSPIFMNSQNRIKMILITPAIFSKGWYPSWLNSTPEGYIGTFPYIHESHTIKLKLVSATIERWQPISGWNYDKRNFGSKPMRKMVPAGSVYFFEIIEGKAEDIAKNFWCKACSDEKQDRIDGFGQVLWGTW